MRGQDTPRAADPFYVVAVDLARSERVTDKLVPARGRGHTDAWLVAGLVLLFAGVLGSLAGLARWKGLAGPIGAVPHSWPEATSISRTPGRSSLLVFIHPGCPCSRATLHELGEITVRHHDSIDAVIVVASVEGFDPQSRSSVLSTARAVPYAHVIEDVANRESVRFGALTSGQTLLFSPGGVRVYAGGITQARGHEGDNVGVRQIVAALSGGSVREEAPVYGCALMETAQ